MALAGGASVVALGAYVYVLGGALLWLRLNAAGLPSDVVTVSFLDRQLLTTGLKALIFEAFLIPILVATVWAAWKLAGQINRHLREREKKEPGRPVEQPSEERAANEDVLLVVLRAGLATIATSLPLFDFVTASGGVQLVTALVLLGGFVVIGALVLYREAPKWIAHPAVRRTIGIGRWILTVTIAVAAIFLAAAPLGLTILVLLILLQFSEWIARLGEIEKMKDLIVSIFVLTVALNLVILSYLATPPVTFDRVEVRTKSGEVVEGAYIGRTGEGVYLGICTPQDATRSENPRIRVLRTARIDDVFVDSSEYSFDHGERPSIFSLAVDFFQRNPVPTETAPLQFDLRGEKPACGGSTAVASQARTDGTP